MIKATRLTSIAMKEQDRENIEIQHSTKNVLQVVYEGTHLKIDRQRRLVFDGTNSTHSALERINS